MGGGLELRSAHLRALLCVSEARQLTVYLREVRGADYLWPGFDFTAVPVCVYWGANDAFLVGHPDPPDEFVSLTLPIPGLEKVPVFYADSSVPYLPAVGPVSIAGRMSATMPLSVFREEGLPEVLIAALIHEVFHAFAASRRSRARPRSLLSSYPELSPPNNALGNLEGLLLHDFLVDRLADAPKPDTADPLAASTAYHFGLVRRERRGPLDENVIEYEQGLESDEGLARYVQIRSLLGALPGRPAGAAIPYVPGPAFRTLAGRVTFDKAPELIAEQVARLRDVNLNAAGAAWWRFFLTGMALGLFADYLDPEWKRKVNAGQSLDAIIERSLTYDGGPGDERELELIKTKYGYDDNLVGERLFSRAEKRRKEALLATILAGSGTRVTFDVSPLIAGEDWQDSGRFSMVSDPAAIEIVTKTVRIHRHGLRFIGVGTDLSFTGLPVVEDAKNRFFHVNVNAGRLGLEGDGRAQRLHRPAVFEEGLEVVLPGVVARAKSGTIQNSGGTLYIKITR